MLKKLLKYELFFMWKFLMIYYIITFTLAGLTRFFFAIDTTTFLNIVAQFVQGAFIAFVISTLINLLMRYWVRFRNNFYGDESYLTHTLPIEKGTQYAAKVVGAIVIMIVTVVFLLGCVLLAYGTSENLAALKNTFIGLEGALNAPIGLLLTLIGAEILIQMVYLLLCGFIGILVGHKFGGARIGLSVLFGAIPYVVAQALLLIVIFVIGAVDEGILQLMLSNQPPTSGALTSLLIVALVVYMATAIAAYFFGDKIFKQGVNVD